MKKLLEYQKVCGPNETKWAKDAAGKMRLLAALLQIPAKESFLHHPVIDKVYEI